MICSLNSASSCKMSQSDDMSMKHYCFNTGPLYATPSGRSFTRHHDQSRRAVHGDLRQEAEGGHNLEVCLENGPYPLESKLLDTELLRQDDPPLA